jgi:dihydroanticapsin dehydrogenase
MKRLQEKTAIVTGGAVGIGRATCLRFAEEGAAVIVADVDEVAGQRTADEIVAAGGKSLFVRVDVSHEDDSRRMVAETLATFGRIDLLVNNAAVFVLKGLEATIADWRKSLDVNIIGTAFVTKHVAPEIGKAGGGAIVNLSSISAVIAQPEFITYSTTKAAIAQMTRCLALDLAGDNIRVNAVCPGTIWTPQVERMAAEAGLDREAAEADPEWGGKHLLGRMGQSREVANAILFLASDESSFITGECLVVDGGYTIT